MAHERYLAQVRLLVRALPIVAKEEVFALKGGTAINLFHRDMPRLSVDIDLVYLPLQPRAESLAGIAGALERIKVNLERQLAGAHASFAGTGDEMRLELRLGKAAIKIESSPVMRGTLHPPETRRVTRRVEDEFGFAETKIVAFADLFAGKMVAALDRQHPRDLYDIKLLFEHEGLTDELFRAFLVYVASSSRPPHELLDPTQKGIGQVFTTEFEGMTIDPVTHAELLAARERLISEVQVRLGDAARTFLYALHDGEPDLAAIGLPQANQLPAIQWKLRNLRILRDENPEKHARQRALLRQILG